MLGEMRLNQTNRPCDIVLYWSEDRSGGLILNPPYQRGDVWGPTRRRNLIKSMLLGIPIPSMIINDRFAADWPEDQGVAVIDGKQRITTLLMFFNNTLTVPGNWFGDSRDWIRFNELSEGQQRRFQNKPLPFSEGRLPDLAAEQQVFDLVNFGGLRQGEIDPIEPDSRNPSGLAAIIGRWPGDETEEEITRMLEELS
jgi:hypothetical protein